jgi:xylose isomerase
VTESFFADVPGRIPFAGLTSSDPLAFKVYEPDRLVLGKRMEEHLRIGVCLWHSFAWDGRDMFGAGTLDRPWLDPALDPMAAARMKMATAFEFLDKLGVPYYCFHDADVAPAGASFAEFRANLDALVEDALGYQERTGLRLLWGTANLFTHPRYQGGASTNPDPEVFAYAAAQVRPGPARTLSRSGSTTPISSLSPCCAWLVCESSEAPASAGGGVAVGAG